MSRSFGKRLDGFQENIANFTGMGTELQYAILNPLATIRNKDSFAAASSLLNNWDKFRNKGLKEDKKSTFLINFESSMERMLEQHYIGESIKKTMLMQEEIFQQQVRELHRLYSIQKMMMDEMMRKETRRDNTYWQVPTPRDTSSSTWSAAMLRRTHNSGLIDLERMPVLENMSTEEGPSDYAYRAMKNDHMVSKDRYDESCVELTLSIGGSSGTSRGKSSSTSSPKLGCTFKEDECSASNTMSMDNSALDQQNKRPRWLFQGLSLK